MSASQNSRHPGMASRGSAAERHASFAEIKDDVQHVRADLAKLGTDAAECAAGTAKSAAEAAMESARHGADLAIDSARKAGDYGKQAHEQMCTFVRERPTTSVLLAVGVGALLARVLIPRR